MKKILILCFILAAILYSQRVVVAEKFTATGCYYCQFASGGIDSLKHEVGDSLTIIAYHCWASDPFNNTDAEGRESYYSVGGIPHMWFDGVGSVLGAGSVSSAYNAYRNWFNNRKVIPPEVAITITGDYDPSTGVGSATASLLNVTLDTLDGICHFVICQRDTPYVWYLDSLFFIERKMYPNYNGTSVTIPPGQIEQVTHSFTVVGSWERDDCYLTVFVQRPVTVSKEIVQASEIDLINLVGIEESPAGTMDPVFGLSQNVPNPVRDGNTAISYTMARSGPVTLKIYDKAGSLVRTLIDSDNEIAGQRTVYWNGKDDNNHPVACGVYLYQLTAQGSYSITRNLVVLR
ncbi:MAG: FlgD immunoglobulin-like domain containing protein [bacterium]